MLPELALCLLTATPSLTVEVGPSRITAGRALIGRAVLGDGTEILSGEAVLLDRRFQLRPEPGGILPLILPIPVDTPDRQVRLLVDVVTFDGERISSLTEVTIHARVPTPLDRWTRLAPEAAALANPEIAALESRELAEVIAAISPARRRWAGNFAEAVRGPLIAGFGVERTLQGAGQEGPIHLGLDYERRRHASVIAKTDGEVVAIRDWPLLGKTVILDHGQGLVTLYAHLDAALVAVGDRPVRGAAIGWAGSSGLSDGVMVHVAAFAHGTPVDPTAFADLPRWLGRPVDSDADDALDARRAELRRAEAEAAAASAKPIAPPPVDLLVAEPADDPVMADAVASEQNGSSSPDDHESAAATPPADPLAGAVAATKGPTIVELPPLMLAPDLAPRLVGALQQLQTSLHERLPDTVFVLAIGPLRQGAEGPDLVVTFHDLGSATFQQAGQLAIELTGRLAPPELAGSSRLTVIEAKTQATIPLLIQDARTFVRLVGSH